jgi:hypothetical protein
MLRGQGEGAAAVLSGFLDVTVTIKIMAPLRLALRYYYSVNPTRAAAPWAALLQAAVDAVAATLVVVVIDYKRRAGFHRRLQAASAAVVAKEAG